MKAKTALWVMVVVSLAATILIVLISPLLDGFRTLLVPDRGPSWYYWKLPQPNLWAGISAWVLYALHQLCVWYLIYRISKEKTLERDCLSPTNIALMIANGVFVLLHIGQTTLFYDGLAQYVPVFSSQASVVVMLVMMLILLTPRRGLFFGKKISLPREGILGIQKTHGYFISWAIVYTFWFHPTESTWGHLIGFFYMFLLMAQMSLAHTKTHTNMTWLVLLESFVGLHGAVIAAQGGSKIWAMFAFGFTMMFVVTQQYGLIKNKKTNITITVAYFVLALLVYANVLPTGLKISSIHEIIRIPLILYALVFVLAFGYALFFRLCKRKQAKHESTSSIAQ